MDFTKLRKAKRHADDHIYREGIEYDFDLMDYVDGNGNVIPSAKVAQMRNEQIDSEMSRPDPWHWD